MKQNRKRRELQNDEDNKSSPRPSSACKRLRLDKLSTAEEAASADDDTDEVDQDNTAANLPVKTEKSPPLKQKSIQQNEDLDATHFSELVGEKDTDRSEKKTTDVSSSKWTRCDQCSKRVLKEDIHSHIGFYIIFFSGSLFSSEKLHKKKKRAERVSPENDLESVTTGGEDAEKASEELSERSEDADDDRDEEPESSPTKVILKEADLVRYTKPFVIYITPLTAEEIEKYTKEMRVIHTPSSSDSEFEKMVSVWILFLVLIIFQVEKSKSSSRKLPRKKVIEPKEPSSDSEDSDVKFVSKLAPKF